MKGIKTDYSMFSSEFLDKMISDVGMVLDESGLGKKGDLRMSTFVKEINRVVTLKEEEDA